MSQIEALYREKTSALQRELKQEKRKLKEEKILHSAALDRAAKATEEQRLVARRAQEEVELLRERVCDLQGEVERFKARTPNQVRMTPLMSPPFI